MFWKNRRVELGEVALQEISEAAVGQFHANDDVPLITPNVVNPDETRVAKMSNGLQGANLANCHVAATATQELESCPSPLGNGRLPDFPAGATADAAYQAEAWIGFKAGAQQHFVGHSASPDSS